MKNTKAHSQKTQMPKQNNRIMDIPTISASVYHEITAPRNVNKLGAVIIALVVIAFILYILLIHVTIKAADRYNLMIEATNDYIGCEKANAQLSAGSDYLTEQARLYVTTLNEQYMDHYFLEAEETRRREKALEDMATYHPDEQVYAYLKTALNNSNQLMQREIYAMKLAALSEDPNRQDLPQTMQDTPLIVEDNLLSSAEMLEKANVLMFGERYIASKDTIINNVSYSTGRLLAYTQERQETARSALLSTMRQQCLLISVLFVENLLLAVLLVMFCRRCKYRPKKSKNK